MKHSFTFLFVLLSLQSFSQEKALFLGNSYTFYNELPTMVSTLAQNAGESLIVESNTPGGYTLEGHSTNDTSLELIEEGDWDFVILQEQSQMPSFPEGQFMTDSYVYGEELNEVILEFNPCAETVFYMTWGRENGDAANCDNWPPVCTYEGMDDLLAERYQMMAEDFDAIVSPVGRVWRNIRENYPEIGLYAGDGSHPSLEGSYAAAVCFFTCIYRMDPLNLTNDLGVDAATAQIIRQAAHDVVFADLEAHLIGTYDIVAQFDVEILEDEGAMNFINTSENAQGYVWTINGVEYTSTDVFLELEGDAVVTLTAINSCDSDTTEEMTFGFLNVDESDTQPEIIAYPNPSKNEITFNVTVSEIQIFDMNGKLVRSINNPTLTIQIKDLSDGDYIIQYLHQGIIGSKKITKIG